jgi:hypothetical protein
MSSTRDNRRVCLISLPKFHSFANQRELLVYLSGALFAIGWWAFADSAIISSSLNKPITNPDLPGDIIPVFISFADWVPGLCSTLGMIIVNLIVSKSTLGVGKDELVN